jgi:hypothetical protein
MNTFKIVFQILTLFTVGFMITGCQVPEASLVSSPPSLSLTTSSISPSKTPVLPTEYLKDPLNGIVVKADCIVSGNITSQRLETVPQGSGTFTYTYSTLTIDKVIKGDSETKELIIKTHGIAFGETQLQVAAKYLICLHKIGDDLFAPEYGPMPTSGTFPIDSTDAGVLWVKSKTVSTRNPLDEVVGRVIQIMRANNIPVALPQDQWPPLPIGPVKLPVK